MVWHYVLIPFWRMTVYIDMLTGTEGRAAEVAETRADVIAATALEVAFVALAAREVTDAATEDSLEVFVAPAMALVGATSEEVTEVVLVVLVVKAAWRFANSSCARVETRTRPVSWLEAQKLVKRLTNVRLLAVPLVLTPVSLHCNTVW